MAEQQPSSGRRPQGPPHEGPPDLILQAIVPPNDAPAEIRAAVAEALTNRSVTGESLSWEDVIFAGTALALIAGTDRRAEPDTEWVFALNAIAPRVGQQLHSCGGWNLTISRMALSGGESRPLWRITIHAAITSAPRGEPPAPRPAAVS